MKSKIAVALDPAAPLHPILISEALLMPGPDPKTKYLLCSEVRETSFGFLQLVMVQQAGKLPAPTMFVSPSYILWMLQAEKEEQFGFVPATR